VYLPNNSNSESADGVVMIFHGYGLCGGGWTTDDASRALADEYNYIMVTPNGLSENYPSWQNQGSNTGLDPDGNNVCDSQPGLCYDSCDCTENCQWTHCEDDDVQFVHDLIVGSEEEDDGFENSLSDIITFDDSDLFVLGSSNGGMFVWTLLQDSRTAGLFRVAGTVISLPHCGYGLPSDDSVLSTPVISITGKTDETVPPSKQPWPGDASDTCTTGSDGANYKHVTSNHMLTQWAEFSGCAVGNTTSFPDVLYSPGTAASDDLLDCKTWCDNLYGVTDDGLVILPPYAVDCAFDGGHEHPAYVTEAAFSFFKGFPKLIGLTNTDAPMDVPTSGPIDAPTDDPKDADCLSTSTVLHTKDTGLVPISTIKVGDDVLTNSGKYDTIYSIDHKHPTKRTNFIRIYIDTKNTSTGEKQENNYDFVETTKNHLIFLADDGNGYYHHPVPAHSITIGDTIKTIMGPRLVVKILSNVISDGLYNILTNDGTVVVNRGGVIVSTYAALPFYDDDRKSNDGYIMDLFGMKLMTYQFFYNTILKPYKYVCNNIH